ncbi:DEAD/DEAH box helicase family protein [Aquabacterium sp.]|uniref:DEAD/DEAH box helicase family protein n=1 Tax=Aquabacterium sp. TaxID=1872578 RepID=UPI0035B0FC3D
MSELTTPLFGVEPHSAAAMRELCERTPGLRQLWIFGSRARGDNRARSDVDFAADAPDWSATEHLAFLDALKRLPTIYPIDCVWWQGDLPTEFRERIERDRKVFWAPRRRGAQPDAVGGISLKPFQARVLDQLGLYLTELKKHQTQAEAAAAALQAMEGMEELAQTAADFPKKTWADLAKRQALPPAFAERPYSSRFDGAGRAIPNVCLKVPTGGGKTLLAAASVAQVFGGYLGRHAGLVLWVVPNEAIYRQTLKTLSDRDHPYRQMLNVAGAGRVKVLEKHAPLSRLDVESNLCVMVLMLQSAARQSKETLKFFRDRGNVLGFLPREDDIEAHWALLNAVPNLDAYAAWGQSADEARAQKGSIVKSSLGNVMRLIRPLVVIDEGHHGYTDNALRTLDGFNPCFLLELSATPRVASDKSSGSNILVDVRGTDLDEAEMIKLPIEVDVRPWNDWQSCLGASLAKLDELQREADALQAETARAIRPIMLVQVERTGADQLDAGPIHAEQVRTHLLQLGLSERQIAIKTSEKNELLQPENIDLLAPTCEVRVIITKQALQEGWDCPFAYVLCALAAGRNPGAMTQLVGRILRQPHTAKTGRAALDACYVQCFDARTADVVQAIKRSLEGEGMGDLSISVRGGGDGPADTHAVKRTRRAAYADLRLFVPKVTWAEPGAARRELVYESDVLACLPWHEVNVAALAANWAPSTQAVNRGGHFSLDLSILAPGEVPKEASDQGAGVGADAQLDRARLVRALLDLAPNAWLVWDWVDAVVTRLRAQGFGEGVLARSSASLAERLRIDVEAERDRLAQQAFEALVHDGRIEFCLRADQADYELPFTEQLELGAKPAPLTRDDARVIEKSLLEPAVRTPDMNELEVAFAGYLDERHALRWWHRNVAKAQYGLQGWKRHKVYPDFVFGVLQQDGHTRTVVMETKGMHLEGSGDTRYKQALLARLTEAFRDERFSRAGELALASRQHEDVVCDLVFDQGWRGVLEQRYFSKA